MTPEEFRIWRRAMKLSQDGAAAALGLSKSAVQQYETGVRRGDGTPVTIPVHIGLACTALYHHLAPWDAEDTKAARQREIDDLC